jgi:hypothetical protein
MRYMMFIKHPGDYDMANVPPALFGAMGEFVQENASKGVFIDGGGLKPLKKATRVRLAAGKITVTDGPYPEAKEVVGGLLALRVQNARGGGRAGDEVHGAPSHSLAGLRRRMRASSARGHGRPLRRSPLFPEQADGINAQ